MTAFNPPLLARDGFTPPVFGTANGLGAQKISPTRDRDTGRSRGFGFVRFTQESDAEAAIHPRRHNRLDNQVMGRPLSHPVSPSGLANHEEEKEIPTKKKSKPSSKLSKANNAGQRNRANAATVPSLTVSNDASANQNSANKASPTIPSTSAASALLGEDPCIQHAATVEHGNAIWPAGHSLVTLLSSLIVEYPAEEAMARDYLLGNDDRPNLFLSITLWLEGHNSARLGTYSLWRSRVLPGQPGPVGGFLGNGTEYAPKCLVRNERFTAPGGNADAGDGEIFFSFADLAPRCHDWIRSQPVCDARKHEVRLTDAERANIEEQIKTADTLDDITRLEKLLNEGKILPSGAQA
ncbi:hypothetical protein BFW01_g6888 [Lasiodiplodia theobromae]|nr:hypothetical protein BFW01_g6888 [Lasiodiplodia theobromae]